MRVHAKMSLLRQQMAARMKLGSDGDGGRKKRFVWGGKSLDCFFVMVCVFFSIVFGFLLKFGFLDCKLTCRFSTIHGGLKECFSYLF